MTRALALFFAAFLALLPGCAAGVQDVGQPDLRAIAADPTAALIEASALLEEVHSTLDAIHRDAAERARIEAPDEAAAHRAIDAVQAQLLPAWNAYDRARTLYLAAATAVRAGELARLAGMQPDPGRIAAAIIALIDACDELARAAQAVGVPVKAGAP